MNAIQVKVKMIGNGWLEWSAVPFIATIPYKGEDERSEIMKAIKEMANNPLVEVIRCNEIDSPNGIFYNNLTGRIHEG